MTDVFVKFRQCLIFFHVHSPQNYQQQKAIAAEIVFQVKIIGSQNLLPSLFSLKDNKKKLLKLNIYNSDRKSLYLAIFIGFHYRFSKFFK